MEKPKIVLKGTLIKVGSDGWAGSQTFAEIKDITISKHGTVTGTGPQKDIARIALGPDQAMEMAKYLFKTIVVTIEPE